MDRRGLLKSAGALAVVGITPPVVSEVVASMPSPDPALNPTSLEAVRDLLLPALYQGKGREQLADIVIDRTGDALLVVKWGWLKDGTAFPLTFAITRTSIIDGSYKAAFKPALDTLCKAVDNFEEYREKFT